MVNLRAKSIRPASQAISRNAQGEVPKSHGSERFMSFESSALRPIVVLESKTNARLVTSLALISLFGLLSVQSRIFSLVNHRLIDDCLLGMRNCRLLHHFLRANVIAGNLLHMRSVSHAFVSARFLSGNCRRLHDVLF